MTANLFGLLNTGRTSLAAQLQALEVSGQNIANAQTKGYSRQTISFEASAPQRTNRLEAGLVGRGVTVSGVERIHDEFLFNQIIAEGDTTGEFQVRKDVFDQMEILLNDGDGRSLNSELSDFFSGFQDIATNPNGFAERSNMVVKAQEMASVFNALGNDLFQIQRNQNLSKGGLTLKGIIQRLPEIVAQKFMSVRRKLLVQIRDITRFNDRIKNLIDRTSLSFHKSLAFVHSLDEKQHSPYSAKGQFCESKLPSRMFSMSA
jgi:hypothetical protein